MKAYRLGIATAGSLIAFAAWVSPFSAARANQEIETQVKPPLPKQTQADAPPVRTEDVISTSPANRPAPSQPDDARGADATGAGRAAAEEVRVAPDKAVERGIRAIAGQRVRGADERDFGSVHDFVVDLRSGEIAFVVVSSGGFFGAGNALRLAPWDRIERSGDGDGFTTELSMEQWGRLPLITEEQLKEGRIAQSITAPRPGAGSEQVASSAIGESQQIERTGHADGGPLIRASDLRGKTLRTAEQGVGTIREIVIDFEAGTAAALVDLASEFTGATEEFLVPLTRLALEARPIRDPITTTLARTEFERAQWERERTAAAGRPRPPTRTDEDLPDAVPSEQTLPGHERLAPTGRTAPAASPSAGQASDALAASVEAVKRALKNDPALAETNVEVVSENGRVVLRGTVRNQLVKGAIENVATQTISPASVDSRITVEER